MQLPELHPDAIRGKSVLVRTDYNEPIVEGTLRDTTRIKASLPTINFLLEQHCRVILMSHLGQPKGEIKQELSLQPIVPILAKMLKQKVVFIKEQNIDNIRKQLQEIPRTTVVLLENLRFHEGEEDNSESFAQQLATLAEVYVNDAFSVSHRKHASVVAIKQYLPWFVGIHLAEEVRLLEQIIRAPKHPFVLVIGGAKVQEKLAVIRHLITQTDKVLIGSAMAPIFLAAERISNTTSREGVSNELVIAQQLLQTGKIVLPVDYCVKTAKGSEIVTTLAPQQAALDIGTESILLFEKYMSKGSTIVWNGPLGYIESPVYAKGSQRVAEALAKNTGKTIAGGGSTLQVLDSVGCKDKITYASTGGGALLSFLSGEDMPGLSTT